jgi:hypothetical protein
VIGSTRGALPFSITETEVVILVSTFRAQPCRWIESIGLNSIKEQARLLTGKAPHVQLASDWISSSGKEPYTMPIPTEPIASIPRPPGLLAAMRARAARQVSDEQFHAAEESALRDTMSRLEAANGITMPSAARFSKPTSG